MDFSKFTNDELEKMLEKHKQELTKMILMTGLEAKAQTIKDIEDVIFARKNGKTK